MFIGVVISWIICGLGFLAFFAFGVEPTWPAALTLGLVAGVLGGAAGIAVEA